MVELICIIIAIIVIRVVCLTLAEIINETTRKLKEAEEKRKGK